MFGGTALRSRLVKLGVNGFKLRVNWLESRVNWLKLGFKFYVWVKRPTEIEVK